MTRRKFRRYTVRNQYAQEIQMAKASGYNRGYVEGRNKIVAITTVALNNVFGFGRKRIIRLENEINRLIEKYFPPDNEVADDQLAKRIKQIMGEK